VVLTGYMCNSLFEDRPMSIEELQRPEPAAAAAPATPDAPHVVVFGASAGGVPVLQHIVTTLPRDFPAIMCAVVHIPSWRRSLLPAVLSLDDRTAVEPVNRQPLVPSRLYVAAPDHHLIVEKGEAVLWHGPKENSHRPAVNALFRSAAVAYGSTVIGVVLSGALEDGSTGLWWIKRHGGVAVVQDPRDAQFPSMPRSALSTVDVDYCLPGHEIAPLLVRLVGHDSPNRVRPGSVGGLHA
jgi:two-component system, chemotaxis family, protein-glutamate methylesterase/glutaminase